jgi:hypothetical protein
VREISGDGAQDGGAALHMPAHAHAQSVGRLLRCNCRSRRQGVAESAQAGRSWRSSTSSRERGRTGALVAPLFGAGFLRHGPCFAGRFRQSNVGPLKFLRNSYLSLDAVRFERQIEHTVYEAAILLLNPMPSRQF